MPNTPYETKVSRDISRKIWLNWVIAFGSLTLPMVLSMFVPSLWVPIAILIEVYVLASLRRGGVVGILGNCSVLLGIAVRTLAVAAIVMFGILLLCTDWVIPTQYQIELYNAEIPFVVCLVIFPISAVFCTISLTTGLDSHTCRTCQRLHGFYAGDRLDATFYFREARYQTIILLCISVVMGALEYAYFFTAYININLSKPDHFFFSFMPLALYIISVVVMRGRYITLGQLMEMMVAGTSIDTVNTLVRFLVFDRDNLLLTLDGNQRWDTPAKGRVPHTNRMSPRQASDLFQDITGYEKFELKYCYTNDAFGVGTNTIHFAAFVQPDTAAREGEKWFSPYLLDQGLATNTLSPMLASELYRIHTITMAWKTYDRNGRRLYPVKHYRPTFRLRDLRNWTVDYDDAHWLGVARFNEDKRFFRVQRLWERMTSLFTKNGLVQ